MTYDISSGTVDAWRSGCLQLQGVLLGQAAEEADVFSGNRWLSGCARSMEAFLFPLPAPALCSSFITPPPDSQTPTLLQSGPHQSYKKKKWCEEVQLNYCLANKLWFSLSLLLLHDYFSATVTRRLEIVDGRKISHQLYVTRGWWASRFLHLHIFSCLPQNEREALHFSLYTQYRSTRITSWQMDSQSYGHLKEKGTRMFLTALRFKQLVPQIMKLHIHMRQLVWLKINEQVPADGTAAGV